MPLLALHTVRKLTIIRTVSAHKPAIAMAKSHLKLIAPNTVNRTVMPKRRPNAELRSREHLTETEVGQLFQAAKANRWGHRDSTMILVAWRHGLRGERVG